jgi:hypothetical protein
MCRLDDINRLKEKEHGVYTEIKDEKAVLDITTYQKHKYLKGEVDR